MKTFSTYFHTLRFCTSRQLLARIRYRVQRVIRRILPPARSAPAAYPDCRLPERIEFLPPRHESNAPADLLKGTFRFLNWREELGRPPDWAAAHTPLLWQYNLHYFDWLWALDFPSGRAAALDWIERHPLKAGHTGWESYPLALRLMNWCMYFWGRHRRETDSDPAFRDRLWHSIVLQANWLERNPEYHLLGNHLLEDGAGLTFAGCCFHSPDAARWKKKGFELLRGQLREQMLDDGLHYERSIMYHSRIAFLLLNLSSLPDADVRRSVEPYAKKALAALERCTHPDGRIALFNDSAFGIYPEPATLIEFGRRVFAENFPPLAGGAWALPAAGYFGFRDDAGDYLICDAGEIGPDEQPGHAHGDIFSFELSLKGQRVIVDAGLHDYLDGEMRRYCRSTAAHNTVTIDDQDQCEFWGAFRVARRGRPRDVQWRAHDGGFRLSGWHDGYVRLPGAPRHYREFEFTPRRLRIVDRIEAKKPVSVKTHLHLHPQTRIESIAENAARVVHPGGVLTIGFSGAGTLCEEDSSYCPQFNVRAANRQLTFSWLPATKQTQILLEWT